MTNATRGMLLGVAVVFAAAACSDDDGAPDAEPLGEEEAALLAEEAVEGCEVLDDRACLLPFPSDVFAADDEGTDTGLRIDFPVEAMPVNAEGTAVDPEGWTGNDGFSPGTPMIAHLGDVDLEASGAAPIGDIERSLDEDAPVIVVDLDAGERVPVWAEMDAGVDDPEDRVLIVRAARNLAEGHRHAVVLRDLVDGEGEPVETPLAFEVYRDERASDVGAIEQRREDMDDLLDELDELDIGREGMQLAWDFTVASERNLSERILAMRDDALEDLGDDGAPAFEITEVREGPDADLNDDIERVVRGTFMVPSYLTGDGEPGNLLNDTDGDWLPERNGELEAVFACQIPESAFEEAAGGVVYGHGLLGSHREVLSGHVSDTAAGANLIYCATDWWGMSEADILNAVETLNDLGNFPTMADRMQQGILNAVLLGRLVNSDAGLAGHEAFHDEGGEAVLNTGEAYYDGNSQGGIMGGAATAISTEWEKAVLGVPGMNYSTLLRRSVDFVSEPGEVGFEDILVPAYPDPVDQAIGYGLIQMLWDRGETNGSAAHLTDDAYPDTPAHQVLLHVAFGDHQVAQVTAEVMARTAGMGVRWPALADDRHPDEEPWFGLERIDSFPFAGSLLVYWDSGTLAPPPQNIAPTQGDEWQEVCSEDPEQVACVDPHEDPRRQPAAIEQKAAFFRPDGEVIDPCDGQPCEAIPRSEM